MYQNVSVQDICDIRGNFNHKYHIFDDRVDDDAWEEISYENDPHYDDWVEEQYQLYLKKKGVA